LCLLDIKNKVLAYENKKNNELIKDCQDALIIVGPEGGFSQQEIDYAISCNVQVVSLTKTILRAETALIYMLSKLN
ncbi:RsmE family RNA methyltransferase, partial [Metamycoplasma hominis]